MTLYGEREGVVRPMPTVPVAGKRGRLKVQGIRHKEKGFRKQESEVRKKYRFEGDR